jgi:hypothetical protein
MLGGGGEEVREGWGLGLVNILSYFSCLVFGSPDSVV